MTSTSDNTTTITTPYILITDYHSMKTALAFWAIGVLNNIPYVVMLAGAKSISEGGTALVFLADVMPGLLVKLSSPYWFEKVSYRRRMAAGSILMVLSFTLVGWFGHLKQVASLAAEIESDDNEYYGNGNGKNGNNDDANGGTDFYLIMQLIGVACCSAQTSLGEATLLALSGKADSLISRNNYGPSNVPTSPRASSDAEGENNKKTKSICITAFSSGTGLAGVLGFAFIVILTDVMNLSLTEALYIALVFPLCYYITYSSCLSAIATTPISTFDAETDEETLTMDLNSALSSSGDDSGSSSRAASEESTDCCGEETELTTWSAHTEDCNADVRVRARAANNDTFYDNPSSPPSALETLSVGSERKMRTSKNMVEEMSFVERLKLTISFWPYMIPLFIVYMSEYALQSGVWTAIGFPVDDEAARASFYQKGNWAYQAGVFISRSSGTIFEAPMWVLWLMPMLQCINLVFFYFVAVYQFWYNNALFIVCFYVGLLGGGVYVNGYMSVNRDLPVSIREFALSTVSVADTLGIVFADISGLFIQSCLYQVNGIHGAAVSCPLS